MSVLDSSTKPVTMPTHPSFIDLTGNKYGRLKVISYAGKRGATSSWNCKCDCNKTKVIEGSKMKSGHTKSCGCLVKINLAKKYKDISGNKYGRLTPIKYLGTDSKRRSRWLCRCDCNNTKVVESAAMKSGNTSSCGCLAEEIHTKHGMHKEKWMRTYKSMIHRCHSPSNHAYARYGGRGIFVSKAWRDDPMRFYKDMGDVPKGMTLDRIDNELGYSKANCRWATRKEQSQNTSTTIFNVKLVEKMRRKHKDGMTIKEVWKECAPYASYSGVLSVLRGRTWKNVPI